MNSSNVSGVEALHKRVVNTEYTISVALNKLYPIRNKNKIIKEVYKLLVSALNPDSQEGK